jgi:hypothetical protein
MYFLPMPLPLSRRTLFASLGYLMLSLLLVNFANEGCENTPFENLAYRGSWVSLAYYASQVLLMLAYLRFQRLGWGGNLNRCGISCPASLDVERGGHFDGGHGDGT